MNRTLHCTNPECSEYDRQYVFSDAEIVDARGYINCYRCDSPLSARFPCYNPQLDTLRIVDTERQELYAVIASWPQAEYDTVFDIAAENTEDFDDVAVAIADEIMDEAAQEYYVTHRLLPEIKPPVVKAVLRAARRLAPALRR